MDPFWLRKIKTYPHFLAQIKIQNVRMMGSQNLKKKIKSQKRIQHNSSIRNNALHNLNLIKLNVNRFMGTGGFLIRYSNSHSKIDT